nr:hypothetical protein Iba_chr11fCG4250 [Ipomoea batatas]
MSELKQKAEEENVRMREIGDLNGERRGIHALLLFSGGRIFVFCNIDENGFIRAFEHPGDKSAQRSERIVQSIFQFQDKGHL